MCESSMIRLPRDITEKLVCVECRGYLTNGPLKIKQDGEVICGKCSNKTKFSTALYCKVLNNLLSAVSFPCVNEKFGCLEYMCFNNVCNHEGNCVYRSYNCPADLPNCAWLGVASQIPQHYRESHEKFCINKATFIIDTSESIEETRLYTMQELNFLVKVKLSLQEGKLSIILEHCANMGITDQILYQLILCANDENDPQIVKKEDLINSMSIEMPDNSNNSNWIDIKPLIALLKGENKIYCSLSINIPETVAKKTEEMLTKIKCPNCHIFMAAPICQCPEGHSTCIDCAGYESECKLCEKSNVQFTRNLELERISASSQIKCRWPNCKKFFNMFSIRKHEQKCEYKFYKCPRCSKWIGMEETIMNHFRKEHDTHPLHTSAVTYLESDTQVYDFYTLVYGEIFGCSLFGTNEHERNFSVWYYGTPSFNNNYRYHFEIRSPKSEIENKSYELLRCHATDECFSFNLKISNDDLDCFGNEYDIVFMISEIDGTKSS